MRALMFTGFLLSTFVSAFAGDSTSFVFNGSNGNETISLDSSVTETRYRTEEVPSTCYREVFNGYQTICSSSTYPVCTTAPQQCSEHCTPARPGEPNGVCHTVCRGGGQTCHDEVRRECHQQAQYSTVAYACTETQTIPYQVTLYKTTADVTFHFGDLPQGINVAERIAVNLSGEHLNVNVVSSQKVLMLFERKQDAVMSNGIKKIKVDFFIELLDFTKISSSLAQGINDIKIENGILSYSIGKMNPDVNFTQSLKLEKVRILARNKVLIDRKLTDEETNLNEQASKTLVSIDLKALNAEPEKGKYKVLIKSELAVDKAKILNKDLSALSVEKEVKLKLKGDDSDE